MAWPETPNFGGFKQYEKGPTLIPTQRITVQKKPTAKPTTKRSASGTIKKKETKTPWWKKIPDPQMNPYEYGTAQQLVSKILEAQKQTKGEYDVPWNALQEMLNATSGAQQARDEYGDIQKLYAGMLDNPMADQYGGIEELYKQLMAEPGMSQKEKNAILAEQAAMIDASYNEQARKFGRSMPSGVGAGTELARNLLGDAQQQRIGAKRDVDIEGYRTAREDMETGRQALMQIASGRQGAEESRRAQQFGAIQGLGGIADAIVAAQQGDRNAQLQITNLMSQLAEQRRGADIYGQQDAASLLQQVAQGQIPPDILNLIQGTITGQEQPKQPGFLYNRRA